MKRLTYEMFASYFSDRFNLDDDQIPRSNFDSFWRALVTVFQVANRPYFMYRFTISMYLFTMAQKLLYEQLCKEM